MAETFRIIQGDALNVLSGFPSEVANCIVTSPPYWNLRNYGSDDDNEIGVEPNMECYLSRLVEIFSEAKRVLRSDGVMWVIIGDSYTSGNRKYRAIDSKSNVRSMNFRPKTPQGLKSKELIGIPWRLAFLLQSNGWYLRTEIVWSKPNPMPESVKDRPHRQHEYIFLFAKSQKYFFDLTPLDPVHGVADFRKTVWSVSPSSGHLGHPATCPPNLIKPLILSATKPGDVVMDPFSGLATVGDVSLALRRRYVGIEIYQKYVDESNLRLSKYLDPR
jgi:site-specific DNA-methyltransferase (cytosine-N4-specific)